MLLKNVSRRLITVNMLVTTVKDGKDVTKMQCVQILPGDNPAVEIPDEIVKTKFIKSLLKDGSLVPQVVDLDEDEEESVSDLSKKSKDELLTIAQMIDPEVKSSKTKVELIAIINGESE